MRERRGRPVSAVTKAMRSVPSLAVFRVVEALAVLAAEDFDDLVESLRELGDSRRQVATTEEHGTKDERRMAEAIHGARLDVFAETIARAVAR